MYSCVEFEKKECAIVPLIWLIGSDPQRCYWPNSCLESAVLEQRPPTTSWPTFLVKKLHFTCEILADAEIRLEELLDRETTEDEETFVKKATKDTDILSVASPLNATSLLKATSSLSDTSTTTISSNFEQRVTSPLSATSTTINNNFEQRVLMILQNKHRLSTLGGAHVRQAIQDWLRLAPQRFSYQENKNLNVEVNITSGNMSYQVISERPVEESTEKETIGEETGQLPEFEDPPASPSYSSSRLSTPCTKKKKN
ncbi:unnamed protein product [Brassicogethes aeneus]|uniref:Uncharacterized protein n=1 Tax=Brassicogethes aeneus TaxID=1431903 RepID=A0A9P0BGV7_BRAAE|nr:unnamed protein product [Brassicogethes aeneus]